MSDLDLLEALWATPVPPETVAAELRHETPALNGIQRQGDLLVLPLTLLAGPAAATQPVLRGLVPLTSTPVVVLASAHRHQLTGRRGASWTPTQPGGHGVGAAMGLDLGDLLVPDGATAWLEHTGHHAPLAIGPGRYVIRRQRAHTPVAHVPAALPSALPEDARPSFGRAVHRRRPEWRVVWD